jgi:hypothetical protein
MTQASEDLSIARLFAEREERRRRDQESAEGFQRRKEEELAAYKQRLENFHLVDEMIPAQLERIKHAFERGESELMLASFPGDHASRDSQSPRILETAPEARRVWFRRTRHQLPWR